MSTKTAKVDQQNKPKAADAWSNVGLYASGHRPTMEQYLKEGYTDCAFGGGPWCENKHGVMRRIVGIFVFYHQDGRVATIETWKSNGMGGTHRSPPQPKKYTSAEFQKLQEEMKLKIGPKGPLDKFLEQWNGETGPSTI